ETAAAEHLPTARKLASLSVDEVCTVLASLGLGKYEAGFRELPVSGAILATVDDADLREAGMDAGMHRKALLRHIQEFQAGGVPPELLETIEALAAKRVRESKDISLIISLMGAHTSSVGVQEAGCVSLRDMADDKDGRDPNKVAISAKGGIEAVVRAMGAHESIAIVQEQACRALANLAANAENQVAIAAEGGIAAVVRAMGAHASSAG
ncbi:hypothetical protein T484DRAFT_1810684, partial [Baffinella frigidus]